MMGFFGFLQRPDLGQGLERFAATPNALLLDVRTLLPGDDEIAAAALAAHWGGGAP